VTPKPYRVPERTVQAQIVAALRSVGASPMTLGTIRPKGDRPGTFMSRGWPDLGVWMPESQTGHPAHWLWIECKAKGGKLRPEQADFRARCQAVGIPHIVGGLDDVLGYLVQHGYVRETAHYRQRSA
jgi:hypothetical protein